MPLIPVTRCATPNEGEGCGRTFPRKTQQGLCKSCEVMDKAEGEDRARKERWGTCLSCGVIWQRLPHPHRCGQCADEDAVEQGRVDATLEESDRIRRDATNQRFHRAPKPNPLAGMSHQPTMPLTTSSLDVARNRGANDADVIKVSAQPRVNGKPEHHLGNTNRTYIRETLTEEVLEDVISAMNIAWTKQNSYDLTRADVVLRLDGNQNIDPGTETLTIGQFYDHHRRLGHFLTLPKHAKPLKGSVLPIELAIDLLSYEQRTGHKADGIHGKSIKRKASGGSQLASTQIVKKVRGMSGAQTGSVFLRKPIEIEAASTKIDIRYAKISVDEDTCAAGVTWPSDAPIVSAVIHDKPFMNGKTKEIYRIVIDGKQFVAKKFVEIGRGPSKVSIEENAHELELEAIRIMRAKWFLSMFHKEADQSDIEVSKEFEFTDCYLVEEIIAKDSQPSPASGKTANERFDEYEPSTDDELPKICWLLEPLRPTAFTRYSGTLKHPKLHGKLGGSIHAFVHYAFELSARDLLFADIQGSLTRKNNSSVNILFDIMSHSSDGTTGVGDHGAQGIGSWEEQHECNHICKAFGLQAAEEAHDEHINEHIYD